MSPWIAEMLRLRLCHLILAPLLLSGCSEDTSEQIKGALEERLREQLSERKAAPPPPPRISETTLPQLLANKLGLYGECIGATEPRVRAAQEGVAALFDGKGALRPAPPALTVIADAFLEKCVKADREGPLLQPPQPRLEAAQAAYTQALQGHHALLLELRELVIASPPPADRADRAVTLRDQLGAALLRWQEARDHLGAAIDEAQGEIDQATLAQIEARSGRGLEHACRTVVIRARPLVRCISAESDPSACESSFFELEQSHGELHAQLAAAQAAGGAAYFWLDTFMRSADDLYASARDFMKQVRGGAATSAGRTKVLDEFADLLHDSAKLNFGIKSPPPAP